MTMYPLWDCSPRAREKIKSFEDTIGVTVPKSTRVKYPFHSMAIGQSFAVPFAETNEQPLRNAASISGKLLGGKRFCVIKHTTGDAFEVARIA